MMLMLLKLWSVEYFCKQDKVVRHSFTLTLFTLVDLLELADEEIYNI
jgi:hypothetical protein